MQLITLNIWGGHVKSPLLNFIQSYSHVDVICLQEVYHMAKEKITDEERTVHLNIFNEIQKLLPNHCGFFRPVVNNIYGICMFVKNTIEVIEEGDVIIHENPDYCGIGPTHSRNLQWLVCSSNNSKYLIANVHGLWNGQGKNDSPERVNQSKRISTLLGEAKWPKILCGDFNLRPDTESISILEGSLLNLVKKNNVKSTRTTLYPKQEQFADYIFTSPEINVHEFKVLEDVVSDHAPLLLVCDAVAKNSMKMRRTIYESTR